MAIRLMLRLGTGTIDKLARPASDRDAGRDRDPARHGHRRESDAKHPCRDFSERVDGVVRYVAASRVAALAVRDARRPSSV